MTKLSKILILGSPNVGKSTLMNSIMGFKASIVTHKVQTTQNIIYGTKEMEDCRIIFYDLPGFFVNPHSFVEKVILKNVRNMMYQAYEVQNHHILLLIDTTKYRNGFTQNTKLLLDTIAKEGVTISVALNKIDLIGKTKTLPMIEILGKYDNIDAIFPISAMNGKGVDNLLQHCASFAEEVAEDKINEFVEIENKTEENRKLFFSEITREKLFLFMHKEIPYKTFVSTERIWTKNDILHIEQKIHIFSQSHKQIILGKQGKMITKIRKSAEYDLSQTTKQKTMLHLQIVNGDSRFVKYKLATSICFDNL